MSKSQESHIVNYLRLPVISGFVAPGLGVCRTRRYNHGIHEASRRRIYIATGGATSKLGQFLCIFDELSPSYSRAWLQSMEDLTADPAITPFLRFMH